MPIITIQLTGEPVTQAQRDALILRSTAMLMEVLHQDLQATGVLIEESGTAGWVKGRQAVTHRYRSPKEYERCLIKRWQANNRAVDSFNGDVSCGLE